MAKMMIRIRSRDGLERVTIDNPNPSLTIAQLKSTIESQLRVPIPNQTLSTNQNLLLAKTPSDVSKFTDMTNPHTLISTLGIAHGSMIYLSYEGQRTVAGPQFNPAGSFGRKMTMDDLIAKQMRVTRQENPYCEMVSFDRDAANAFQNYVNESLAFAVKRGGIMYGTVSPEGKVEVDFIYEPPQQGTEEVLILLRDPDEEKLVEAIAMGLGMRKVGFIFTQTIGQNKKDYTMSNVEVLQAAELQAEGDLKEWVTAIVKLEVNEEGGADVHFEAFQMSDMCIRLFKEGWFEREIGEDADPKLSRMKKDVVVGGKDTKEVDNDFFLVVVKIFDHQGPLSSIFPIENRITPVPVIALKNHLDRTRSLPFVKQISDFHLLLLLARFLDVNADVPALAQCVQTQMAIPEGYQLLIESLASACCFPTLDEQNLPAPDPKSRGVEDSEHLPKQVHQYSDATICISDQEGMSGTAPERVLSMEEMARLNEMGEVVTQGQNLSPEDKDSLTSVTDELSHVGKVVVQPDKQILCVPDPKSKGEEGSERLQLQLHQYSDSLQGISDRGSTSGTAPEGDVLSMEELVVTEGQDLFPQDEELAEDLSGTTMHTLPQYIFGLVALQKLLLRNCEILMMELPPEIGDLKNLEVLDLEGTEILCLPAEIAKLVNLTCLKVSFYGSANQTVIPKTVLSNLSRLKELIIDVTPYGEWWDVEVKDIIDDLRNLKELTTLQLSLPTAELLEDLTLILPGLANFRFTVGRHEEHFISRLPRNVEEEFNNREKLEKGLKFINGKCIPNEITKVLKHANAFFLQRHWTAESLSEFGHENLNEVKFFLVMECNEFRTIIDSEKLYQGKDERAESDDFLDFDEAMVLGSLQRLIIRYMKHMESIWKGPVAKGSLSNLKSLALHTCPKLTTLFTIDMLSYLTNLEELIVEDCPKINSLVSHQNSGSKSVHFLPSLKKISLLHLPGLVTISSGQGIAPKFERMVVFYCPKLEKLSATEVSSTELKVIKGDKEWWDALKWYESDLSTEDEDYLACLFIPLRKDGDLMAQLTEDEIAGYGQGEVGSDCLSNFSDEQLLEEIPSEELEEIPSEEFEEIRSEKLEETSSNHENRRCQDVSQLESISEDASVSNKRHNPFNHFIPTLRSGEWSDIGCRSDMEDTHICIRDLAKTFGYKVLGEEAISFYGVYDGHGGKGAAQFVRDHLPRVIVEDADFPLELEKVVTRSFLETDAAFARSCTLDSALSSGTTALTAMIFGRSLLVANAGDCRAVLSRCGIAIEMSKDHRPCRNSERMRIESLGGYIDDGYLNGQLSVTRALGDWDMKGFKKTKSGMDGPLSAEPELKLLTLTKEDEFLIIGSDGMWDVFGSQNAVDFARRRLQEHNDVKKCCKEIVEEAIKRQTMDNVTVVMVCFHSEPPPPIVVQRPKVKQSISPEGLVNIRFLLEG